MCVRVSLRLCSLPQTFAFFYYFRAVIPGCQLRECFIPSITRPLTFYSAKSPAKGVLRECKQQYNEKLEACAGNSAEDGLQLFLSPRALVRPPGTYQLPAPALHLHSAAKALFACSISLKAVQSKDCAERTAQKFNNKVKMARLRGFKGARNLHLKCTL